MSSIKYSFYNRTKHERNSGQSISKVLDLIVESGADLSNLFKQGGLLKQLTKGLVERALQAEMKEHLGYDKYQSCKSTNSSNGVNKKNLFTEDGMVEINVPRDRIDKFEPVIIPK